MPELPDLTVYLDHLDRRITGETLHDVRLTSPFVLRTVSPVVDDVRGRVVTGVRRLAKQIVFDMPATRGSRATLPAFRSFPALLTTMDSRVRGK